MSATDVLQYPIYNCKFRKYVFLRDSEGDLIALNTGDTELSKDGAALADATNELAEISTGYCSIDFPYTEMAYQHVGLVIQSTGAQDQLIDLYPRVMPTRTSGTAQAGDAAEITLASGASAIDGAYTGCYVRASNNDPAGIQGEVRLICGYTGSTKVCDVWPNWENTPTSATTYEVLVPTDLSLASMMSTSEGLVDEWETQSQADPTGFQVNVKEVNGTAQTANDNGADINSILDDTGTNGVVLTAAAVDSILDEVVEGAYTLRQLIRGIVAAVMNDVEDNGLSFRDIGDTKDRFTAVTDDNANRNVTIVDLT